MVLKIINDRWKKDVIFIRFDIEKDMRVQFFNVNFDVRSMMKVKKWTTHIVVYKFKLNCSCYQEISVNESKVVFTLALVPIATPIKMLENVEYIALDVFLLKKLPSCTFPETSAICLLKVYIFQKELPNLKVRSLNVL